MTLASNPGPDFDKLAPNARRMHELRAQVLSEWEKRLRENIREAKPLAYPILINTIPALYDHLLQAITPGYPRISAVEGNTFAVEHGGERARLTSYNAQALILEYQLLRRVIFDVLRQNGVELNNDECFVINSSIDDAIRESVHAFALAQAALREQFVAAVTHDLRNPLAAASAAAQLIDHLTGEPQVKNLAARIRNNLTRMDEMIRDLLDAVMFQSGERLRLQLHEFDIYDVTQEVCNEFGSLHGERFQLSGENVRGYWDRSALKRAIENLLDNAVKYGMPGSMIDVNIISQHERVLLKVHNDGEPIPPEQMEGIFQVFRRASQAKQGDQQGWGIGLPYVRSVAESHGGSVNLDSAAGRGTTFIIDMPMDARPFQDAPTLSQN